MTKQELEEKLLSTGWFIDNKYLHEYADLMTNKKPIEGYAEIHHILQKQYFKLEKQIIDNSASNKVMLLYKDHLKAHYLLFYCTIGKLQQANAASVEYMLRVYNNISKTKKNINNISEQDLILMQHYYDNICKDKNSKYYTIEELNFIKNYYPSKGTKYCAEHLGRTIGSIHEKVSELDLKVEKFWTEEKVNFLKQNYPTKGGKYCADKLRTTPKIIFKKVKRLGLTRNCTKASANAWTQEELTLLIQYYPIDGTTVYKRFKNRSYAACRCMASKLGLHHKKGKQNNGKDNDRG